MNIFEFFSSMLKEGGDVSSTRFMSVFIVVTLMTGWLVGSIMNGQLLGFGLEELGILTTAAGLKVGNKFAEKGKGK